MLHLIQNEKEESKQIVELCNKPPLHYFKSSLLYVRLDIRLLVSQIHEFNILSVSPIVRCCPLERVHLSFITYFYVAMSIINWLFKVWRWRIYVFTYCMYFFSRDGEGNIWSRRWISFVLDVSYSITERGKCLCESTNKKVLPFCKARDCHDRLRGLSQHAQKK